MMKPNRTFQHSEEVLYKRLKFALIGLIAIPIAVVVAFVMFGPLIGSIFGIFSVNRNYTGAEDTIAPPPPIFNNPPNAVNSQNINIDGYAEEGTTIKLFVNGPELSSTIATTDGTFTFENIELIKGRNTIFAKSYDTSNNESPKSITLNIQVDTEDPELEILEPKDEDIIRNLNKRVNIKGTVNEKATVKVNEKLAILRPDLSFEFPLGVTPGEVEIVIEAIDEAGNSTKEEFKITYIESDN